MKELNSPGLRPDQITHRLVGRIPHPDRRQLSRPVQLCQHESIAPVGLYPVARLHRIARGRNDHAVVAKFGELPVQAITAWTGLMADMKLTPIAPKLVGELADMIGAVRKYPS